MRRLVSSHGAVACVFIAWLLPAVAAAQRGRVTIDVDRHIGQVGEPIQVTVNVEVEGRAGYDEYVPPSFEGFEVAAGGVTTQNVEIVNWQVRRHESYGYTVMPQREGALTIGPAAIIVGGRRISSSRIIVQVKRGASAPAPQGPAAAPDVPSGRLPEGVSLSATAVPAKVYQGQQVVTTWYLLTQSDVLGFQLSRQPTTDHFWAEELRSPNRLTFERRVLGNRLYYAAVIARKALFPQRAGQLTIGPMAAQVRTLEDFAAVSVSRESEAIGVEVLPLPEKGRPPGFPEVNVGRFDIAASLDRSQVKGGEGVTLRVVVRGEGNLRQLKLPGVETLDGFKVYKPKVEERLALEDGVSGEKLLDYLLLPVRSGRLQIPALHLDYFDPESASYRRSSSQPLSLVVVGSAPSERSPAIAAENVLGPTIRPPRQGSHLSHHDPRRIYRHPLFLTLLLFPVAFLLLVSGGERLSARLARVTPQSLRRAAERRTRQHLARARELYRAGASAEVYAEIAAGLRSQLDHRLGVAIEGLTRQQLEEQMRKTGLDGALIQHVIEELAACDAARFAPGAAQRGSGTELEQVLARVKKLVHEVARAPLGREQQA